MHPSAVLQNRVIEELAQEEFEVYAAKDEAKLKAVLWKYPDAIVFACINEGMKEDAWEKWIREVMTDTASVSIGVISNIDNADERKKYTEDLKLPCGYIVIKSDIPHFIKQMALILNHVGAKGSRKFIRLPTEREPNTTVNIPMGGQFVNGFIRDISVVGFSCFFEEDPELTKNKLFPDIQLRLHSQLLNVDGIAYGSRIDGDDKTYVMLFTQKVDSDERSKIRKFIHTTLQTRMDNELR